MTQAAAAVRDLGRWTAPDGEQRALRDLYLTHLRAHPGGMSRDCRPGHLTASAAVFDAPGRRVLLTLHRKVGRWLQLGGHCEPGDATLAAAALREATEESGIAGLALLPSPVRLDRHAVRCGPVTPATVPNGCRGVAPALDSPANWTWHLDVQFAAIAPPGAQPVCSAESTDVRWWPVSSLPASADDSVRRLVASAWTRSRRWSGGGR